MYKWKHRWCFSRAISSGNQDWNAGFMDHRIKRHDLTGTVQTWRRGTAVRKKASDKQVQIGWWGGGTKRGGKWTQPGGRGRGTRSCFVFAPLVYLVGTLPDDCGDFGHHHVHTLQTGSFQFEDLLFHNGLEGQVRGEEPRSERAFGTERWCCVGGRRQRKNKE